MFFAPRVHLHLFCPLSQFARAFPFGSLFLSQTLLWHSSRVPN